MCATNSAHELQALFAGEIAKSSTHVIMLLIGHKQQATQAKEEAYIYHCILPRREADSATLGL